VQRRRVVHHGVRDQRGRRAVPGGVIGVTKVWKVAKGRVREARPFSGQHVSSMFTCSYTSNGFKW
jgi:hypothetical protein